MPDAADPPSAGAPASGRPDHPGIPTPSRVLAVYAHPDDPEVSAGGTLARWAAEGARVWTLVTTRGDKGTTDPGVSPEDLVRRRREEAEAAAAVLGTAGHHELGYPDGEVPDDAVLREAIVRHVRELRPDTVLCPDPTAVFFGDRYFNHRDHRVTGWATLDAVASAAGNPHYFPDQLEAGLEVHRVGAVYLSGTLEPNCFIDVSDHVETKIDAIFCHASQLAETGEWFRQALRDQAAETGRAAGLAHAEAFRRLSFDR
ncbi:MAG: PIG-L family deacetylase [Acidimicrobiia bacterium]|nr:PIG-L family deacetylase [Acidimicrobiia bacterium]